MKIEKIVTIIIVFSFLSCRKHAPYLYEVIDLKLSNTDNSGEEVVSLSNDSILSTSYAIELEYIMKFKGAEGNSATPSESQYKNVNKLKSFNIYSLNDFNIDHSAGTSLNEYFLISKGSLYGWYKSSNTINSIIGTRDFGGGSYNDYGGQVDSIWSVKNYLILMETPTNKGNHTFIIDIIQSNNNLISDTTTIKFY